MTLEEAKQFLDGEKGPYHLALDRIAVLLEESGHPEKELKYVHIAGTNGKGSILAYLSTALTGAGYKVGRFSSPVVYTYGEQFQIDGENIPAERLTALAEELKAGTERMEKRGIPAPSGFEREVCLALLYFAREKCDIAVMECGMGGETDATNIIPSPMAAVFASISLDHSTYLGGTVAEIARIKSGIIKPGCTAVTSVQDPEAEKVIAEKCGMEGCPLVIGRQDTAKVISITSDTLEFIYKDMSVRVHLPGICQVENAIIALETLKVLQKDWGIRITDEQILEGLEKTVWKGRFARVAKDPDFIVDGAHNPGAARELRRSIETYYPGRRLIFLMGMFADKDYDEVIRTLAPLAAQIFTVETPDNPRALPARELAAAVSKVNPNVSACNSLSEGIRAAFAAAGREDVILSFGSLSNIAAVTRLVQEMKEEKN